MLRALIGHWKTNRKKPSLLPEDGDILFEEITTINPLFEDSQSSITSNQAAGTSETGESPATDFIQDSSAKLDKELEVDNLVDLAIPPSSSSDFDLESEDFKRDTEVKNLSALENFDQPTAADEDVAVISDRSDSGEPSAADESNEQAESSIGDKENMRIYQPPPNVPSNNQQSASNISGKKESFERLATGKPFKQEQANGDGKEVKPTGILKNRTNQNNSEARKFSPTTINASRDTENPANLRARAIDELIRRFQGRSNGNDEVERDIKESAPKHLNTNPKLVNGVTKVEQNDSPSLSKPFQTTDSSNRNNLERESLTNIFNVPPPPPLENFKQGSRLHGKILAQPTKTAVSPKTSPPDDINNVTSTSDNPVQGTTRSDSSLERTRVASSKETKKDPSEVAVTKGEETWPSLESRVRGSFLHSPKRKEISKKSITESVENVKAPDTHAQETVTRKVNAVNTKPPEPQVKSFEVTTAENASEPPQDQAFNEGGLFNITRTENAKVNLHPIEIQSTISNDASLVASDLQIRTPKEISPEKEDTRLINETVGTSNSSQLASTSNNSRIESTSNNSQPSVSENPILIQRESPQPQLEPNELHPPSKSSKVPNPSGVQKTILKSSLSKASANATVHRDPENGKSYSEDSGITRGDQISSETTQDATPSNVPEGPTTNSSPRKPKKERKQKSSCKKCRRNHGSFSVKRSQYDDYYDILTGVARNRRSDSFASDLSWDERELLKRLHALRSLKGTVRSNAPSIRSRLSRHDYMGDNFRRFRYPRPSSDEGAFAPSVCSCDECWAQYAREHSYSRASLRGMSPVYMQCTCKTPRNNMLGRRVKFMSDPIPEVPLPEKISRAASPASKSDSSKAESNASEDRTSKKSSDQKGSKSVSQNPDGSKQKKHRISEKEYRLLTPWELEQWDLLVRKEIIQKRRKRARCMGLIALALVIFVGLIVTILMLFLKRRVL